MDKNKLDQLIRSKLTETERAKHPTSGWEGVANQLPPTHSSWAGSWKRRAILMGGLLLLISNLILIGIVLQQQQNLDHISNQLKAFKSQQVVTNAAKAESPRISDMTQFAHIQSNDPKNTPHSANRVATRSQEERDQDGLAIPEKQSLSEKKTQISEIQNHTEVDPSQRAVLLDINLQKIRRSSESEFTQLLKLANYASDLQSDIVDYKPGTTTEQKMLIASAGHPYKRNKSRRTSRGKPHWKDWKLQTGITAALPRGRVDFGLMRPGTGTTLGLGMELHAPGDRLRLSTGIEYSGLAYKTDDHVNATTIAEKYADYPNLSQYGNLDKLHEIDMHADVLQVPIQVKLMLTDNDEFKPWLGAGIVGRFFLHQDYVYEFEDVVGEAITFSELGGKSSSFGIGELSIGGEYAFSKRLKGQLAFVYRLDFAPQGLEKRRYHFWGMQVGIWHNWGKKKRY